MATLARYIGCSERHTRRLIAFLESYGLVRRIKRGYATNEYEINKEFIFSDRTSLMKLFPALKTLTLASLMSVGIGISAIDVRPKKKDSNIFTNVSNTVIERGGFLDGAANFLNKKSKREIIRMNVGPIVNQMGTDLSFSDYGKLMFVCFQSEIISQVYDDYKAKKKDVKDPLRWIWARCRQICNERDIKPNYDLMYQMINTANFKPGDRLYFSDPESQPKYEKPASRSYDSRSMKPHSSHSHSSAGSRQSPQVKECARELNDRALAFLKSVNRPNLEEKIKKALSEGH